MSAALKVPTIFTAVDKFTGVLDKMQKSVGAFASKTEAEVARTQRTFRRIADTSQGIAAGTGIAGAAVLAPLALATNAAIKYEDSIASLSAITGATGAQLDVFKSKVEQVGSDTKKSYTDVAKAFELAGSAMPELLDNADALAKVSKASIVLAKASREDTESSIRSLTGTLNQFSLGADQAERVINVLASGAKVGAASISQTSDAMVNFGSTAAGANLSVEKAVGMIQLLSKFGMFGAEAGNKLKGSILKLQQAGVGYASGQFQINDALGEVKNKYDKLKTAKEKDAYLNKVFMSENVATGRILLSNIGLFEEYTKGVTGTAEATLQAGINSDTAAKKMEDMKNQIQNLSIKIGEVLLPVVNKLADIFIPIISSMTTWAKENPKLTEGIVNAAAAIGVLLLIMSGIASVISTVASFISSLGMAAKAAIMFSGFIKNWVIPTLQFFGAAVSVLFNMLLANPIGLIIAAIAALVAIVVVIIKKWNDWGAAIALFLGPIGWVISLIQSFRRNWDMLVAAFKTEGIIGGFKAIGKIILDAVLMPLQQVLNLVAKVSGADWAKNLSSDIEKFRVSMGVNTTTDESGKPLQPQAVNTRKTAQDAIVQRTETSQQKTVVFDFKNVPKGLAISGDGMSNASNMPATSSTFGFGNK